MSERAAMASHAEKVRRLSARFNEDVADQLYEDVLRACRDTGHDLDAMVNEDGRESLACRRCDAVFEEVL